MKKSVLLTCLVCVSYSCFAQTLGIRGGVNMATQVWKYQGTKFNPDYRLGALGAITLNLEETEKISAQLELSYSQMGFGVTKLGGEKIPEGDFKYMKIGCAGKYHLVRSVNVHLGAELGFLFESLKDLRYLAGPDFGAFLGAEYYFIPNVGVGGRYYFGLSDVNSGGSDTNGNSLKQLNRAFQLYIALRFPGKQLKEMGY